MNKRHDDVGPEDRRDHQRITEGWLIQRCGGDECEGQRRYLQIATGQWCGEVYATLFPIRETAVTYAIEFGYQIGKTAKVVRFKRTV